MKRKKMRDFVDMSKPLTTAQLLKEYRGRTKAGFYKDFGNPINPHPHTTKQLNKMTKKGLIRLVVKLEKFILSTVYQMYKSKLPRLRTIRQKALPRRKTRGKKMTKAEKTEFLARLNKGRIKAGLKPIRAKR